MVSVFPKEFLDNCEHVHKYLKMDKIGEGSYGEVYIGEHRKNKQKVAIKKLLNLHINDIAKAAYREIELLSKLRHKNIIELIDVCQSTGLSFHLYTIFPLCNLDLSNLIENTLIILTNPIIKDIMQQLLDGISYIHSNNVMHRDLKPQNIFISENGSLKIGDFGVACEFKQDNSTVYSSNAFSFWYRPPELLLGATNYGPSVDLWCIGCIFAELWIRTPLFQGNSVIKQLSLITQLCGSINTDTWSSASKLKLYDAIQLKEDQVRTIKKLEIHITDSYGLDLLDKLLVLNPIKRITAADALMHEYFKNDPQPALLKQLIDDLDL